MLEGKLKLFKGPGLTQRYMAGDTVLFPLPSARSALWGSTMAQPGFKVLRTMGLPLLWGYSPSSLAWHAGFEPATCLNRLSLRATTFSHM